MNVWKIGSRWSENGQWDSSVLDIFWKHGIVFVGGNGASRFLNAKKEDLVAIADGFTIVGVGKLIDDPKPITMLKLNVSARDKKRANTEDDGVFACRVALREVPASKRPRYCKQGKFCQIKQFDLAEKIRGLWRDSLGDSLSEQFDIRAGKKTLDGFLRQSGEKQFVAQYFIPIYQRPYAWGSAEVEKFVHDILESYFKEESLFIGTIQLSKKEIISPRGRGVYMQEIIDGQQRITTVALMLRALSLIVPNGNDLNLVIRNFEWLETRVSNGEQQKLLEKAFSAPQLDCGACEASNPYLENAQLIYSLLIEAISRDPEGNVKEFSADEFLDYMLGSLMFVVIETHAGLSKTLQIFNTINTAGLDLNGGDLFKVRMYEYLRDIHGSSENSFNEISHIYAKIDEGNRIQGGFVTDISGILNIYRHIVVARKGLPVGLVRFGVDAFYDRLFDARFRIKKWDNFARVYDNEAGLDSKESPLLNLSDLSTLIDLRYAWEREWRKESSEILSLEVRAAVKLIHGSRYGSYWILLFVFQFCFGENSELLKQFIVQLSKLFIVFSALYGKAINEMHAFLAALSRSMFSGGAPVSIVDAINVKLSSKKEAFEKSFAWEIAGNMRVKYLLCRLSELLHAQFKDVGDENRLLSRVFDSDLDIEHIKAYHDKDNNIRWDVWEKWGSEINAIGNLMVLERNLNRSIGNKDFCDKILHYANDKEPGKGSQYQVVKDLLCRQLEKDGEWGKPDAIKRREDETTLIMSYIYKGLEV